jgi:tRNA(Glu) U13 pseudouridine synthase TruD
VFGLEQCINDIKKYDIDACENKFDPLENVSIKTSSNNNIDCGDILRFFNGDFTKKYTIILIRYTQKENHKCVKEILEIAYTSALRDYLFGTACQEVLQQYVDFIKTIPSGPVAEDIKKEYKVRKGELQKTHNMSINISPKVDSKSQRRVQCSIPKVDSLLEQFPEIIISRTSEPVVRNVHISAQILSAARVRNKKI